MIVVEPACAAHGPALGELFRAAGCGCFCRYWHFTGTKNDWLARLAETPDQGAAELEEALARGGPDGRGLVALDRTTGEAIGWLKLCPLADVPKLRAQGAYRGLDLGEGDGPLAIGCFLVHPEHRRRGLTRAMLTAAIAQARAEARVLLGFPRRSVLPLYDEAAFSGPESAYVSAGFHVLHDSPAYPVYAFDPRVAPSASARTAL